MNPSRFEPHPRGATRRTLCRLLLVVTGASTPSLAATAPLAAAVPPAFPDAAHVTQGCYISTVAYLARFAAAHPAERGHTLRVDIPTFDGPHTIALVSWRGGWWARDEYCGVFPLDRPVRERDDIAALRPRAEGVLRRLADRSVRQGKIALVRERRLTSLERERDVSLAAALLPGASATYWVRCGAAELPFLFFQPKPGKIAVYDPATGTATADCDPVDAAELVRAVARRIGYEVCAGRSAAAVATNGR